MNITLYEKYPATWVALKASKAEKLFFFRFKQNFKYGQWFAIVITPLFHFEKDNCNLKYGLSLFYWQLSLHFHK